MRETEDYDIIRRRRDPIRAKRGIRSEAEEIGRMPLRMRQHKIWTGRESNEAIILCSENV